MAAEALNTDFIAVEVQVASKAEGIPSQQQFEDWVAAAMSETSTPVELVIRIVDEDESRALNSQFRSKDKPTNVLSFPFEPPPGMELNHLGDLVVCAPVVQREAVEQHKPVTAHWAHMVVHGVLHLQGYDHQDEQEASVMEAKEIDILERLGYPNPYA
jgi:probable rRNA maturation factor